ncbi:MAG TPA: TRAP transporter small permease [Burkholderiales bacterium]|nr:TRAP transporter small permease [Burkholderiales bacterium]
MTTPTPPSAAPQDARALRRADRWLAPVEDLFNFISAMAIFSLMLLGVTQIVLRSKLVGVPIYGYIDLVELSMATFAFLGAAYCQRLGDHVRMELLIGHLKGRSLWFGELIGTLLALAIVGCLGWFGWEHFLRAYELGDSTIDAEYPVWPSKLLVPVAFAVWFLRLLIQLIGFVRLSLDPQATPVAVPTVHDAAEHAREEIRETFGDETGSGDSPR